ncbi:MAG: HIT family protein [Gammaproteobacteria bacterium]|nr:HIT family protein [Gammaproteobacteria bacterium]
MSMNCPFCPITDPHHRIVFERDLVLFTQNSKYQGALKHSGIIIPRAHRATAFDLDRDEVIATFELLYEVKSWMDSNFQPAGYNLGWNCGETAGQQVMHAHFHVIPRFREEPLAGTGIRTMLRSEQNQW